MTDYYLAPPDRETASAMLSRLNYEGGYRWPTVVAFREGAPVGAMVTQPREDLIAAGPLIAPSMFVALKLVDYYERLLAFAGVARYTFAVERTNDRWLALVERASDHYWRIGEDATRVVYLRALGDG